MTQDKNTTQKNNHPQPPLILSLDVGTSSTRAMLFDATGTALPEVSSQIKYKLTTSRDGEATVDANDLLKAVGQTIDELLEAAGPLAQHIKGVATDTFWHSLLGVDADGKPIMPLITWEDTRPSHAAAELCKQLDEKAVHARTGARLHASYWPAKLRWLATQHADIFSRAAQWISFGEYLHRMFLGSSVCSLSMASATGLFITRTRTWDTELMKVLKVRSEELPQLGDLRDSIKGLTPEYASRWPALRDVPWFPAIGDGAAASIGSNCAAIENWALTIGTSSAMRVIVNTEQVVPPLGLWLYLVDTKRAVFGGALSEGGNVLNCLIDICKLPALKEAEADVGTLEPDSHGLTVLPFISGERSLGWHGDARMTLMGLSLHTTPTDILHAAMEALAYQLAAVYEQLCSTLNMENSPPRLIASGGALLSSSVLQCIIADTLAVPVYLSHDHEASARGAALLALEALGVIENVAQIEPAYDQVVQPDTSRTAIYRKAAERQRTLYHSLLGETNC